MISYKDCISFDDMTDEEIKEYIEEQEADTYLSSMEFAEIN